MANMKNVEALESTHSSGNSNKLPPKKEIKERKWLPYLITAAVLAALTLLMAWARGCFVETNGKKLLVYWSDALFLPGLLCLLLGFAVLIKYGGLIKALVSVIKKIINLLRQDSIDRKYSKYYDNNMSYDEQPRPYGYLITVGGAFFIVAIVLASIYVKM